MTTIVKYKRKSYIFKYPALVTFTKIGGILKVEKIFRYFECPYCGHRIKKNQAGYTTEVIPIMCDKCDKKILNVVLELEKEWVKKHMPDFYEKDDVIDDVIANSISDTQHNRMKSILNIIRTLSVKAKDGTATRGDIIREAKLAGLKSSKVEVALDRLRRDGRIYEAMHGKYRITEY